MPSGARVSTESAPPLRGYARKEDGYLELGPLRLSDPHRRWEVVLERREAAWSSCLRIRRQIYARRWELSLERRG
jgi:hypothetical protein